MILRVHRQPRNDFPLSQNAAGVKPTKLYSRNFDVDRENEHCLNDLPGASVRLCKRVRLLP